MYTLNCKGKLLVADQPLVMGIINATPDSFYEGSRFMGTEGVLAQAEKMLKEGADMIDIGGQSSRPGAGRVPVDEELKRVIGAVESLHYNFPEAVISVDTYYAEVARQAVAAGASLINDISAGTLDDDMLEVVAGLRVPYVCMHMKGEPGTMQREPRYDNVVEEVLDFFIRRTEACRQAGIHDVILDPGLGFGKTPRHNFQLLQQLSVFKMPGHPLLIGISRKSTIWKTLGVRPEEALNGSTVLHTLAVLNGADILRVHDVKEAKEVVKLMGEIYH